MVMLLVHRVSAPSVTHLVLVYLNAQYDIYGTSSKKVNTQRDIYGTSHNFYSMYTSVKIVPVYHLLWSIWSVLNVSEFSATDFYVRALEGLN